MSLQPENRYPSPRALAEDIERWMADEPISALRESLLLRARRWARKHRTAVAAAAGLLITSTIALAVVTVLITREWNEARAQRNEARAQGRQARQAVHLLTKVADSGFDEQLDPLQGELQSSIGRPAAEKSLRGAMTIFEGLLVRGPASRKHRHSTVARRALMPRASSLRWSRRSRQTPGCQRPNAVN